MEEHAVGDISDPSNPFYWDKVILNLPSQSDFNPTLPFVIKQDSINQRIATAIRAYVHDLRIVAATMNLVWLAAHQIAAKIQYFGSQDAPRNRRRWCLQ